MGPGLWGRGRWGAWPAVDAWPRAPPTAGCCAAACFPDAGPAFTAGPGPARSWYPAKPSVTSSARPASATPAITARFGRRPDALDSVTSSSMPVAEIAPGARWVVSNSLISGRGSAATTLAMLRICPRA